jgi:hypothetical protein
VQCTFYLNAPFYHCTQGETCESNYRLIALEIYFQNLEINGGNIIKIIVKLPTPNKGFIIVHEHKGAWCGVVVKALRY